MTRPTAGDRERGSITLTVAVLMSALLLVVWLVVDGGLKVNALAQASDVAAQAAHAAGQQLDTETALQGGGVAVNPSNAEAAAQAVLAAAGMTGDVQIDGNRIRVTATCIKIGLLGQTIEGTGSAEIRLASEEP